MDPSEYNRSSSFSHADFVLFGFPGVTHLRPLLALPFSSIYVVILSGNSVITLVIVLEKSLHTPMYTLILSLLVVNVVYTSAITPKMVLGLFGLNHITLAGCLAQMLVVYCGITTESVILLLMALDRYLAISQPLHYHEVVVRQLVVLLVVNGAIRNACFVFPLVILGARLPYCRSNVIYNFHCENMMLLKLGCEENDVQVVGLSLRTLVTLCDIAIIFISYLKILHTALRIVAGTARHKALHTCSTHLLAVVIFYTSGFIISVLNLPGISMSYDVQNLCSAIYFLLPATLNPFIYGVRMEKIKSNVLKYWGKKRGDSNKHVTHGG